MNKRRRKKVAAKQEAHRSAEMDGSSVDSGTSTAPVEAAPTPDLARARRDGPRGPSRTEDEVNDIDARLWHPWLRINRVLRVMLHTRWSAEAWAVVRVELRRVVAVRSEIRRAG